jgi:cytochrome bd-I ubiquinol oxidase subunit X
MSFRTHRRFAAEEPERGRLGRMSKRAGRPRSGWGAASPEEDAVVRDCVSMWYFAWILGLGLACAFAILNAMWLELDPRLATDPYEAAGDDIRPTPTHPAEPEA